MSNKQEEIIQTQNFESLLKKCLDCQELELVNLSSTKLLPPGENYCSLMVKLEAVVRRDKRAKEETLHFVAKTFHRTDRPIIDWFQVFKKELFIFAELLPAYQRLEREMGIEPVFDVLPKYVGHRCSLDGREDIVDEHSFILMENLKVKNYYNCERRNGMDVEHARIALSSLARFHSLGLALKQKRPDFHKKAIAHAQTMGFDFAQIDTGFDSVLKPFRENESLSKHLKIIEESFAGVKNGVMFTRPAFEPWLCITHGDFWVNNILFHKNEDKRVDDVKFVDFQTYLYNSPIKDLPYFLSGSIDEEAKNNHFDELLKLYHDTLISSLDRLGCDAKPYSRESFDRELKQQAINEFPLSALALKFFVFEVDQDNSQLEVDDVFHSKASDAFVNKLNQLIQIYEKRGWF